MHFIICGDDGQTDGTWTSIYSTTLLVTAWNNQDVLARTNAVLVIVNNRSPAENMTESWLCRF